MPFSDEKVEEIMTAFKDMMGQMSRVQAENSKLHNEMLAIMKEKSSVSFSDTGNKHEDDDQDDRRPHRTHGRPKPKRPVITEESDDLEWVIFQDSWKHYKTMTKLEE